MTRNSIALMRDGSVMADSDLVDFLSGPTDSAINFNGSADLHTPIHPPPLASLKKYFWVKTRFSTTATTVATGAIIWKLNGRNLLGASGLVSVDKISGN